MANNIKDLIDFYTTHEVSDDIKGRVLERISDLKDDKDANDCLRALWNQAESSSMTDAEVDTAYSRLCKNKELKRTKAKRFKLSVWTKVAAVVIPLFILAASVMIFNQIGSNKSQNVTMIHEYTAKGETKVILLQDGTEVKLSPSSVLLYPSDFHETERKVFLTGEAFFDIKHNDKYPFHVTTPHFEITDLGTSFTVSSYTEDDKVSTTLKTGKVELRVVGDHKVYNMEPNDQLVYNVKTKSVSIRQVAQDDYGTGWRNKTINLNDVTLLEATDIMSEVYGVKFTFDSDLYQNTKITVHFNRGESLYGAMIVIKNLVPELEYAVKQDEVILK